MNLRRRKVIWTPKTRSVKKLRTTPLKMATKQTRNFGLIRLRLTGAGCMLPWSLFALQPQPSRFRLAILASFFLFDLLLYSYTCFSLALFLSLSLSCGSMFVYICKVFYRLLLLLLCTNSVPFEIITQYVRPHQVCSNLNPWAKLQEKQFSRKKEACKQFSGLRFCLSINPKTSFINTIDFVEIWLFLDWLLCRYKQQQHRHPFPYYKK